jgi:hydroxyacylglutathione hydrolase
MKVTGALVTHYHPDHVGGSMMGHTIEGIAALLERVECPIHLHRDETEWVSKSTGVGSDHFVQHESGDTVTVGGIDVTLLHTPGHTPGSQCFLVDGRLVAGDTLFLEGCGRTDLPGSDPAEMARSLRRLAEVPDETILFPGHRYSVASSATMDVVKEMNFVFDSLR